PFADADAGGPRGEEEALLAVLQRLGMDRPAKFAADSLREQQEDTLLPRREAGPGLLAGEPDGAETAPDDHKRRPDKGADARDPVRGHVGELAVGVIRNGDQVIGVVDHAAD